MFYMSGYFVGYMVVLVVISVGDICVVGDVIFVEWNFVFNFVEKWCYWVFVCFVNFYEGWKFVEEIDKCVDYVLLCYDEEVNV